MNSYEFNKVFHLSEYEPKSYSSHCMFLRDDRKILIFGFKAGVASFSLQNQAWSEEKLTGDLLYDVGAPGFTDFFFNNTQYVAIFGGISELGIQNDLFL